MSAAHEIPFTSLLKSVPQAICLVDGDSVVRFANSPGAAALGFGDPDELIGQVLSLEARSAQTWLVAHAAVGSDWAFLVASDGDALHATQRRVIVAGDEARRQVSHDLHDGAQQDFVTVVINLQLALQKWEADPEAARALVASAIDHAKLGVQGLRQLVDGIHPLILTSRGLGAAIEAFAGAAYAAGPAHRASLRALRLRRGGGALLPGRGGAHELRQARQRIARDRPLRARARINLQWRFGDDGVGGAELSEETHGLTGLADRIGALDGTLTVTSEAGAGTLVRASVPLRRQGQATLM